MKEIDKLHLEYDQYTIEELCDIMDEFELTNIDLNKYILNRILKENDKDCLFKLFNKIEHILIYLSDDKMKELFNLYTSIFTNVPINFLLSILRDTIFGNSLFISIILINNPVYTYNNIEDLLYLNQLKYIDDDFMLNIIPDDYQIDISFDDRINDLKKEEIKNVISYIETFFYIDIIRPSKSFIEAMKILYKYSDDAIHKVKYDIIDAFDKGNNSIIMGMISRLSTIKIRELENLDKEYKNIFYFLRSIKLPVYYDYGNIIIEKQITNNNFYYMLYKNKYDEVKILNPFNQVNFDEVREIFDLKSGTYITPYSTDREISVSKIHSFQKMNNITSITDDELTSIKNLDENNIELRLQKILSEYSITDHGPTEKIDIWTSRLSLFHERDIRVGGFLIKGKSYKTVYLKDIAVNLLKALDTNIDILFLVYSGNLDDGARDQFITHCKKNNKLYSLINLSDLTKIFKAYNAGL